MLPNQVIAIYASVRDIPNVLCSAAQLGLHLNNNIAWMIQAIIHYYNIYIQ